MYFNYCVVNYLQLSHPYKRQSYSKYSKGQTSHYGLPTTAGLQIWTILSTRKRHTLDLIWLPVSKPPLQGGNCYLISVVHLYISKQIFELAILLVSGIPKTECICISKFCEIVPVSYLELGRGHFSDIEI